MPDYLRTANLLRRKAADPAVGDDERSMLIQKAKELEDKYSNVSSHATDDTTVFTRDGRGHAATTAPSTSEAWETIRRLVRDQYQWNSEYYDKNGKPKPGYGGPDLDEMYEEEYKYGDFDEEERYDE